MTLSLLLMLTAASGPCALEGWSTDTDPAGLRVHAGPAIGSPEIGRLPPPFVDRGDSDAPAFTIVDARDGWVRITGATDATMSPMPRAIFKGTGWVHGSRVAFTVQSETGRSRPDVNAPVMVRADDWLGDAGEKIQPITGCRGGWARLRYRIPANLRVKTGSRTGEAWFGGICGSEHTTCDSLSERNSTPAR